jgi:hypothetical protein
LISLNSVFSFFLSRVSNFTVQKAGSGFSSRGAGIFSGAVAGVFSGGVALGFRLALFLVGCGGDGEMKALLLVFSELTLKI